MPLHIMLVALVFLLILSGFFSLSETSMMAINRYRLRYLAKQGHRGARLTVKLLDHTDRLLGVILLGNNLLNTASATLVAVIVATLFAHDDFALIMGTIAVTFAILVFSEITPKVIAAAYPERIALASSYVLTPLLIIFYPIVWFINLFVGGLLILFRLKPKKGELEQKISPEELKTLVLEGGHFIQHKHQGMLLNLLDLETITVDDVIVPRGQIEAINLDADDEVIHAQLLTCHHTRLPVYRERMDNIVGIVHVRKVLNQMQNGKITAETLEKVMRKPYFIPSGTPLFSQLQLFQENQKRVGLVVDEYGEWMGLVTLEDILEEIIGDFTTHAPTQTSGFLKQEDGSIIVEGSTLLRELNRKLDFQLPLDGPKTLNGLILEHFQDIPEAGIGLSIAGYPMEIIQTKNRVVKTVKIFPALTETKKTE
ncbi:Mg2+/Co2+ transporter CorB [Nitrosomonas sp. Nm84]|uniref:HlyC/CorC family transporter n=1 Tax=Nitrosomonas sp. Nm84 TaxID=200124 RepID=UPI000D75FE2C|nr:HlyC/CorC family transporter [Nitrosomonas sp. Nm84]PXW80339.1 Mg2+/Co2+ transporter CorB [Nitrosomonas sp. Nm84]